MVVDVDKSSRLNPHTFNKIEREREREKNRKKELNRTKNNNS